MKKILSVLLIAVCIFAFSACDLLDALLAPESVTEPTATTPPPHNVEATTPGQTTPEQTTPEQTTPEQTTPEQTTPEQTTPEQTTPEQTTPEQTTPEQTTPEQTTPGGEDEPQKHITVRVKFQSGGIHGIDETLQVEENSTFNAVYFAFVQKYDLTSFRIVPYLNGQTVDVNKTVYLQEGDYIYLEEYSGMPGEEPVCPHVWRDGSCSLCGAVCEHSEWNDNRQCLVCGAMLGVDLLHFEIYENGEHKYYFQGIETTLGELLFSCYPYPWEYLEANYEFYFNGALLTDASCPITESGRLELITRSYGE